MFKNVLIKSTRLQSLFIDYLLTIGNQLLINYLVQLACQRSRNVSIFLSINVC